MEFDAVDDIVQDFLVESREILDSLGSQLVELEQQGGDRELLNAVFRGFHTIKGGAGFLSLEPLVDVCHRTEDLFNLLRNGERQVTAELMDYVLQALDVVNAQFDRLEAGEPPEAAPSDLLEALEQLTENGTVHNGASPLDQVGRTAGQFTEDTQTESGDISDDEFEQLLDALEEPKKPVARQGDDQANDSAGDDDISEEEFEALLDELHGRGRHQGVPDQKNLSESVGDTAKSDDAAQDDEQISEDEFENLLDELHGKGRGPTQGKQEGGALASKQPDRLTNSETAPKRQASAAAGMGEEKVRATASRAETTVRVGTAKLDDIMNLVGELVLVRNRLNTLRQQVGDERLGPAVGDLELVTSDLQAAVMQTRMQPIKKVFGRFPRLVRDLARGLGKSIELEMRGEDTDLDKNLVEALADPLVHLVRNSCDHGIEMPEDRKAAGKPASGLITLSAEQEGDHILLIIADDGKGMNPDALRRKVVEKGLMDAETAARLDDTDCFNLIFLPGFSTKEEISDVSGRGVGMDVVKTRISQLNGTVDIASELGVGTTLRIKVPLTLAILPTLMVALDQRKFALPTSVVKEIFELDLSRTKEVDGRRVVMVRNKAMPLFFLDRWVSRINSGQAPCGADSDGRPDSQQVVTVVLGHQPIGLVVDDVLGLEEVVIKPLGAMLHGLPGLAGSTITGDGRIALIIDIPSLVKSYGGML